MLASFVLWCNRVRVQSLLPPFGFACVAVTLPAWNQSCIGRHCPGDDTCKFLDAIGAGWLSKAPGRLLHPGSCGQPLPQHSRTLPWHSLLRPSNENAGSGMPLGQGACPRWSLLTTAASWQLWGSRWPAAKACQPPCSAPWPRPTSTSGQHTKGLQQTAIFYKNYLKKQVTYQ